MNKSKVERGHTHTHTTPSTEETSTETRLTPVRSLGREFRLHPNILKEALGRPEHANDLARVKVFLKDYSKKITAAIADGQLDFGEATQFVDIYREFAGRIDDHSARKAPQIRRMILSLASSIESLANDKPAISEHGGLSERASQEAELPKERGRTGLLASVQDILEGGFLSEAPEFLRTEAFAERLVSLRDGTAGLKDDVEALRSETAKDYSPNTRIDDQRAEINVAGCKFATFESADGGRVVSFYLEKRKDTRHQGSSGTSEMKKGSANVFEKYTSDDGSATAVLKYFLDDDGKCTCFNIVSFTAETVDEGLVYVLKDGNFEVNYFHRDIGEVTRDDAKPIYYHLAEK